MLRKSKTPYIRDVYLAYLIDGANRTRTDEYPVIESWMVATEPPKEIIQWDRRQDVVDPRNTAICFYCNDIGFTPILNNPKAYVEKFKKYGLVVGIDASPYDNMPIVVQKSQIYLNLAITYYYGNLGIKIIPNVRLGDNRTLSSLEAYPKHTLIAIGTHGFTKLLDNRYIFADQVMRIVDSLEPKGICVYGPTPDEIFGYARLKGIPIYQYDSYTMKENAKDKAKRLSEVEHHEGKCPLFTSKTKYASGDLMFRSGTQDFFNYISRRKNVDADGFLDIVAHGSPNSIQISHNGKDIEINSRTLAQIIRKNPQYKKQSIRLLSCNTGSLPNGFAQNLANKLGVVVHAPNKLCWSDANGNYMVASRSKTNPKKPSATDIGEFIPFYPGGNRR